jgi:small subunit ribosomal protein S1
MTDDQGDSFAALFEQAASTPTNPKENRRKRGPKIGDRMEAIVVKVGNDSVFVELDGKQQAFLDAVEFRAGDGTMTVKEGDTVRGIVLEVDDKLGYVRLGKSLGKMGGGGGGAAGAGARGGNTAALELAKASDMPVSGKVIGVNKGGIEVEIGGTKAFCPMSQIGAKFVEDPSTLVGQSFSFMVTEIREGGKGVVVSRRAALAREASESAGETLSKLGVGVIVRGTVTGVRDFGAFVDLGGVEGLIPRSEISHDRGVSTSDALKAGDVVEVVVREVKEVPPARPGGSTHKITLSLKALKADPWDGLDLPLGQVMEGTVTRVLDFGAFVKLAAGVEGLLHASEMGGKGQEHKKWMSGQAVSVVVKSLDAVAKKISLVPAPDGVAAGTRVKEVAVRVGAVVEGVVDRIETYGVFMQIDGTKGRAGRGLVPAAELGVERGVDLRKRFPEGTRLVVKVLETGDGKLRFSVKAAKDAEERAQYEEAREKVSGEKFGTFGDLLKKLK